MKLVPKKSKGIKKTEKVCGVGNEEVELTAIKERVIIKTPLEVKQTGSLVIWRVRVKFHKRKHVKELECRRHIYSSGVQSKGVYHKQNTYCVRIQV